MGAVRERVGTGFVGLGVKAVAQWQGRFLMGLRSAQCATYPSMWEFAPGGSAEPGEDPAVGIARELAEECALECASPPLPVCIVEDPATRNWEIVHQIDLKQPPDAPPNWEYSALELHPLAALPADCSPITAALARIAERVATRRQHPPTGRA